MENAWPRLGCLVMAAGNARRFGENKLTCALEGRTLIERTLEAVPREEFAAVCVVSQYEDIEELPEKIAGASHAGRRGNPNMFPARFFPELLALEEDRGGNLVIKRHPDAYLPVEVSAQELLDCDTPQELERLKTAE